jgi:hypothetical protein
MLLKGADDGSVALRSQLDPRAQSEAARCFGFNENHVSILFSKEVIRRHKEMLDNVVGQAKVGLSGRPLSSNSLGDLKMWFRIHYEKSL